MKYNLKNCPFRARGWTKGFEAELRKKFASKELIAAQDHDETLQWAMKYRNALIQEILGE